GQKSNVYFKRSIDGGASFEADAIKLSNSLHFANDPQIAAYGNNVYVIWQDNAATTEGENTLFIKSNDGGNTFGNVVNLSNTDGDSKNPDIAVGPSSVWLSGSKKNNIVFVLWEDDSAINWEIFLAKSIDGGNTFGNVVNLSNNEEDSSCPNIA